MPSINLNIPLHSRCVHPPLVSTVNMDTWYLLCLFPYSVPTLQTLYLPPPSVSTLSSVAITSLITHRNRSYLPLPWYSITNLDAYHNPDSINSLGAYHHPRVLPPPSAPTLTRGTYHPRRRLPSSLVPPVTLGAFFHQLRTSLPHVHHTYCLPPASSLVPLIMYSFIFLFFLYFL